MRPAVLLGILCFGTVALLAVAFFSPRGGSVPAGEPAAIVSAESPSPSGPEARREANVARPQPSGNANEAEKSSSITEREAEARVEKHEAEAAARISELRDLSRKTDPAAWEKLLAEITNPDQMIREAAIDIISQSGNRDVIPLLADVAAQTEDAAEKKAITDAIEFLSLPTFTEILRQTEQKDSKGGSGGNTKSGVTRPPSTGKP